VIVTGPVARFARQIAGQGYIVAAPSSYHDFTGPEALAYDVPGTDQGNEWKIAKVSSQILSVGCKLADMAQHCFPRTQA
jgi:carboxymethylenebutenolidase